VALPGLSGVDSAILVYAWYGCFAVLEQCRRTQLFVKLEPAQATSGRNPNQIPRSSSTSKSGQLLYFASGGGSHIFHHHSL